jgi:hypothetical protein
MGPVTETRSTLLNFDQVVEEVHVSLLIEDYETVQLNQDLVSKIWNDGSPKFRASFLRHLVRTLFRMGLEDKRDLNGFFSYLTGHEIPVLQEVRDE